MSLFIRFMPLFIIVAASKGSSQSSAEMLRLASPADIEASDGTYEKFVLVRWQPSEKALNYKVFRALNEQSTTLQEVSNNWQKSTWICDYSAVPDVTYFYTVVASNGKDISPTGTFDKGYLKKKGPVAIDDSGLMADRDVLVGAQKKIFLLIAEVMPDKIDYFPGQSMRVNIELQNIFDQPTHNTELRYFLSDDAVFDWNDSLLGMKSLSSLPSNVHFQLEESITLPDDTLAGEYFILFVASTEGEILSSKTAITKILIKNE